MPYIHEFEVELSEICHDYDSDILDDVVITIEVGIWGNEVPEDIRAIATQADGRDLSGGDAAEHMIDEDKVLKVSSTEVLNLFERWDREYKEGVAKNKSGSYGSVSGDLRRQ